MAAALIGNGTSVSSSDGFDPRAGVLGMVVAETGKCLELWKLPPLSDTSTHRAVGRAEVACIG